MSNRIKTVIVFTVLTSSHSFHTSIGRVQPFLTSTPKKVGCSGLTPLFAESPEDKDAKKTPASSNDDTGDILNSPAFLKRKVEVLKTDIEKTEAAIEKANADLEEGKTEWGRQLESLEKEYQTALERSRKLRESADSISKADVAKKVLDVLDNFGRAFSVVEANTEEEKEVEAAYKSVETQILAIFSDLGIQEIETIGAEFDYEKHNAVMMKPSDYDEGIVCEEFAKGYIIGEELLRPAMVSVSA